MLVCLYPFPPPSSSCRRALVPPTDSLRTPFWGIVALEKPPRESGPSSPGETTGGSGDLSDLL